MNVSRGGEVHVKAGWGRGASGDKLTVNLSLMKERAVQRVNSRSCSIRLFFVCVRDLGCAKTL